MKLKPMTDFDKAFKKAYTEAQNAYKKRGNTVF